MTASWDLLGLMQNASNPLEPLHERQQLVAVLLATGILVLVLELVRRRRLREEFSWVWVTIASMLLIVAFNDNLIVVLSGWIGTVSATSTLFFAGLVVLMMLALQSAVRLSRLTERYRTLAQRTALLEAELADLRREVAADTNQADTDPTPDTQILPLHKAPAVRSTTKRGSQEGSA